MPEKTIKTDGLMPLQWKWMLHIVYDDRFEVAHGAAWCPRSSVTCALAVMDTFDEDDPHESAQLYAWNSATHEKVAVPLIRMSDVDDVAAV